MHRKRSSPFSVHDLRREIQNARFHRASAQTKANNGSLGWNYRRYLKVMEGSASFLTSLREAPERSEELDQLTSLFSAGTQQGYTRYSKQDIVNPHRIITHYYTTVLQCCTTPPHYSVIQYHTVSKHTTTLVVYSIIQCHNTPPH